MARRIATVCARAGSKGVPGKNLRRIAGLPLIAHTIRQAVESHLFDAIAVSSDSEEILDVGMEAGATHRITRPDELATDTAGKCPAIAHAVRQVEALEDPFRTIVDLSVTAPLRSIDDIRGAIEMQEAHGGNVITGCVARNNPYFSLVEIVGGVARVAKKSFALRRQDAPPCFDMNGSIYVWGRDFLANPRVFYDDTALYEMPADRSFDIDTETDFAIVRWMMEHHFHTGT